MGGLLSLSPLVATPRLRHHLLTYKGAREAYSRPGAAAIFMTRLGDANVIAERLAGSGFGAAEIERL
jgi:hypothetical protein